MKNKFDWNGLLRIVLLVGSACVVIAHLFQFSFPSDLWLVAGAAIYVWYRFFTLRQLRFLHKLPVWLFFVILLIAAVLYRYIVGWHEVTGSEFLRAIATWELLAYAAIPAYIASMLSHSGEKEYIESRKQSRWLGVLFGCILITVALAQSVVHLSDRPLQNDEFLQYEAAHGYLQTGDFVHWDYVKNTVQYTVDGTPDRYTRGRLHTWFIAQSFALFGESEMSARLPAVFMYVLFILCGFIFLIRWHGNIPQAFLIMMALVMMDHIILHGRLVRMYSTLLFMTLVTACTWFALYRYSLKHWWSSRRHTLITLAGGAAAIILSLVTIEGVHRLFATFFPALMVFVVIESILSYMRGDRQSTIRTGGWVLAGISGLVGLLIVDQVVPFLQEVSFGIRTEANMQYEVLPFLDTPIPLLAVMLYLVGLVMWFRKDTAHRYVAVISAMLVLIFTYFVTRYNAMRYALFIIPFVTPIVFVPLFALLGRLKPGIERLPAYAAIAAVCIPLSLPGIPESVPFFQQSRADRTVEAGYGHDFAAAYTYIQAHAGEEEPIFVQELRDVYWGYDPERLFIDLGERESLKKQELIDTMLQYDSGWFVWSEGKSHHIRKQVRQFIEEVSVEYSEVDELAHTQMVVYHFTKGRLEEYLSETE